MNPTPPAEVDSTARRRLWELSALAAEVGLSTVAAEAAGAATRVGEGRFHLAAVGQFKRGKSTLVNALLGQSLLPTGIVPVTAVVTVVRYGARRQARVQYRASMQRFVDLAYGFLDGVAEETNAGPAPQVLPDERGFRTRSRLFFTDLLHHTGRGPGEWLLDRLRLPGPFQRAVERDALSYFDAILRTNAARVSNDLDEQGTRLVTSFATLMPRPSGRWSRHVPCTPRGGARHGGRACPARARSHTR